MLAALEKAELMLAALVAEPAHDPEPGLAGIRESFQKLLGEGYPPRLALSLALRLELAPAGARLLVASG
jgi:hypothetical protein